MDKIEVKNKPSYELYIKLMSHPMFERNPEEMEAVAEFVYQSGYRLKSPSGPAQPQPDELAKLREKIAREVGQHTENCPWDVCSKIEQDAAYRSADFILSLAMPILLAEGARKEREGLHQYMMGFPHTQYPISERCLCSRWNCKWFEPYEKPPDEKQFPIGWCKRFEPDPDAGYIMANQLPPCVVWAVERQALKGEK